ncbi:MAG: hypothetical protein PWP08_878 [Methanofollis sp.]|nr:hypothetical protein [Methanofollis sp.]
MQYLTSCLHIPALALVLTLLCAAPCAAAGWSDSAGMQLPPLAIGNGTVNGNASLFGSEAAETPVATATPAPPDPDDYAAMAEYLVDTMKDRFTGAAAGAPEIAVSTFEVITDADLADPAYLGCGQAVKVDIVTNTSGDVLAESLWGHEVDATRIAEAFFSGDFKGKTAFVAVFFRDQSNADYSSKFMLTAKDASRFGNEWDGSSYIRWSDWSDAVVRGNGVPYEDPETAMEPLQEADAGEQIPCDYDTLKSAATEATESIASTVSEMSIQASNQDYGTVATLAVDLTGSARAYAGEFETYSVPDALDPAREQFIEAFEYYEEAGSAIWYGAAFTDADHIDLGNTYLSEAQDSLNAALDGLNLRKIEDTTLTLQSTDLYPDALDMGEPYKFLDSKEVNKISVGVRSYVVRKSFETSTDDEVKITRAPYGKQYLFVLMEVTHIGYYGGGSSKYKTPSPADYTLIAEGAEYKPSQPSGYLKGIGSVYASGTIDRKDYSSGYLVFEVPESVDPAETYLKLSIKGIGTPIWNLS